MLTTQLPGFIDITRDSQSTFRTLLAALAEPGVAREVTVAIAPPKGMTRPCAAACLTLLDLETVVWLQPGFSEDVQSWLRFHTGCRFTAALDEASFVVVHDLAEIALTDLCWGSAETPELSATLLAQVTALQSDRKVVLTGPGILDKRTVSPALPMRFWQDWPHNHAAYPRGVDVFLFDGRAVMGLPRTTSVQTINAQLGE
ncbi:MAG: phosphonate C-P lyase system protein PhnH [Cyanobacteria bacterium J06555_13]